MKSENSETVRIMELAGVKIDSPTPPEILEKPEVIEEVKRVKRKVGLPNEADGEMIKNPNKFINYITVVPVYETETGGEPTIVGYSHGMGEGQRVDFNQIIHGMQGDPKANDATIFKTAAQAKKAILKLASDWEKFLNKNNVKPMKG